MFHIGKLNEEFVLLGYLFNLPFRFKVEAIKSKFELTQNKVNC